MTDDRRIYWVWLAMVLGAGSESFWKMCRGYRSISDFAENVKALRFSNMNENQCERAKDISFRDAEELIVKCAAQGVDTVIFRDERYPKRLKRTPNPPTVLFVRGDADKLNAHRVVSVVGTRTPCDYSLKAAREICAELARNGALIVSGAEVGIDVAAIEGALSMGHNAAALLGRGILEENALDETIEENCLLVSEYTDRSSFGKVSFNNRNRILCGLCDLVLFVEARADSRGLNNVKHAELINRPVFCVPPADIFDIRFKGQQLLLTNGAQPAFSGSQILARYAELVGETLRTVKFADIKTEPHKEQEKTEEQSVKKVKKVDENAAEVLHNEEKSAKIDMSGLSQEQKAICELLKEKGSLHLNQIAEMTELPVNTVVNELTLLSIEGTVKELPGKSYKL